MKFRDFYVRRIMQSYHGAEVEVETNGGSVYLMNFPDAYDTDYKLVCNTSVNLVNLVTVLCDAHINHNEVSVRGLYDKVSSQLYQGELLPTSRVPSIKKEGAYVHD